MPIIKKKWVSWGSCRPYDKPVEIDYPLDERVKWFAVLDETMNTHAGFVRVSGQEGYIDVDGKRINCLGWQSAGEVGVEYHVHDRYKDFY